MPPSGDELAGIVDLFGALTREELHEAVGEATFRAGGKVDDDELQAAIAAAIEDYRLVRYDPSDADGTETDSQLLVAGPTAFPELPDGAEDLRHILDVDRRDPDREALGRVVASRFRAETARAVDEGDRDRIEELLDVSYDVEAWAPVALTDVRNRLDDALAEE